MLIYIGADHRGFELKEKIKIYLAASGYPVHDVGNARYDKDDDYPDFAESVAKEISADPLERKGILVCGSGVGVNIVANKFRGVRSLTALSPDHASMTRSDEDTNVLCLSAEYMDEKTILQTVGAWLQTPFSGSERHKRRLQKIAAIESRLAGSESQN